MILEVFKFIFFSILIVGISKYILVIVLRKLAESLNIKAKTVGDIAGTATSMPELLTITTSSLRGLVATSIYNILSSNIINLIQYLATIFLNKNISKLKNYAIKIDMILVIITIIIPIIMLKLNIQLDIFIVPLFIICYALFAYLNNSVHKTYLNSENEQKENKENKKAQKGEKKEKEENKMKIIKYIIILVITGFILYKIGDLLGNTLENLCEIFNIPEFLVGILLGVITSIPELITFFEAQKYNKQKTNELIGVVEATNNLLTSNILNLFVIQTIGIVLVHI